MSGTPAGYEVTEADLEIARSLARKYARRTGTPHLRDEWEGAAMVGLAQAAAAFDPGRGPKFWTFAGRRVCGAIADAGRDWMPQGFRRHESEPPGFRVGPIDREPEAEEGPVGWEVDWHDEIEGLSRRLTGSQSGPFRAYYGRAASMAHAGRLVGLKRSTISKSIAESHRTLAGRFAHEQELFMGGRRRDVAG